MTPEQKAERLEQIRNDPSALESYLDTADELSVALIEELTLNRKQSKEIKALQEEHAVWEKHSLCKLAEENVRLREALGIVGNECVVSKVAECSSNEVLVEHLRDVFTRIEALVREALADSNKGGEA